MDSCWLFSPNDEKYERTRELLIYYANWKSVAGNREKKKVVDKESRKSKISFKFPPKRQRKIYEDLSLAGIEVSTSFYVEKFALIFNNVGMYSGLE